MNRRSLFYFQERFFAYEFLAYGRKFKGSASRLFQVKITHFAGAFAGIPIQKTVVLGVKK